MANNEVVVVHGTSCEKLLSVLLSFRQTKKFCDITLVSGERNFYAHSCVLAAVSPYFMGLLRSGMSDVQSNFIKVNLAFLSVSTSAVNSVLDFLYGKDIEVDSDNVFELLALADYLLLTDLKNSLSAYLCKKMTVDNPIWCIQTWRYAQMYACKALYEFSDSFMKTRFYQLSKTTPFCELTLEELESLVESEELAANENEVLDSIIKWVNHSVESRKESLNQLLKYTKLDALSQADVQELLVVDNLYQMSSFDKTDSCSSTSPQDDRQGQEVVVAFGAKTLLCYVPVSEEWCNIQATIPVSRKCFQAVELNGLVYVLGGIVDSRLSLGVWCYNPETNEWRRVAPMLKTAASFGVASLDGHLYAVGGPKREYNMQRYNPSTDTWCFVKPMQIQRDEHCVVAFQNKYLFVIGGQIADTSLFYSVERYDIHSDTWSNVGELNIGRIESSAIALQDKIFVAGGYGGANHHELRSCEVYNSVTNTWCLIASTVLPRRGAGIAVIGGKVHLFGGNSGKKGCCEFYCEESKRWQKVGSEINTDQRLQCCTVVLSGRAICRNLLNKTW